VTFVGLPALCPPAEAVDADIVLAYRILDGQGLADRDWLSHTARGTTLAPGASACEWAAVSLFTNPEAPKKYKNLKGKTHAARVSIPAGSGVHTTRGAHINFWCHAEFVIADFFVDVVGI
jgi:hypothetical protein